MTVIDGSPAAPIHLMTDHPGWTQIDGRQTRAFGDGELHTVLDNGSDAGLCAAEWLTIDQFDLSCERGMPFAAMAASLGTVERFRNPSLWDAIATAIIRQVIRASQAKKLYRNFCIAYGERVLDSWGTEHWLFPRPERLLELDEESFREIGMAFKRKGLRSAATAYLAEHEAWKMESPSGLVDRLQSVSHIGPWTARAAVADYSNDWSLYPYDDLAVRTWARHAIPEIAWADDESAFASQWRELSGDQLAGVTLLTLAWGDRHVSTGQGSGASSGH